MRDSCKDVGSVVNAHLIVIRLLKGATSASGWSRSAGCCS